MIDPITGLTIKNNQSVQLQSMHFTLPKTRNLPNNKFTLTGTISHSGDMRHGHYVSYLPSGRNLFMKLDDNKLSINQNIKQASHQLCTVFAKLENDI